MRLPWMIILLAPLLGACQPLLQAAPAPRLAYIGSDGNVVDIAAERGASARFVASGSIGVWSWE